MCGWWWGGEQRGMVSTASSEEVVGSIPLRHLSGDPLGTTTALVGLWGRCMTLLPEPSHVHHHQPHTPALHPPSWGPLLPPTHIFGDL